MRDYWKELFNVLRARRLCISTVETYRWKLHEYLGFCYHEGLLPEEMPHEGLVQFMAEGSEGSQRQRRALLVNLYEFVLGQGYKLLNLPYAKKRVTVPESLSPSQIQAIFNAVKNPKQRLILKIMYACGLRVSEAVKIHTSDFRKKLNLKTGKEYYELRITGKGAKERLVPVPDQTMIEIASFIGAGKNEYLFKGQFKSYYSTGSVNIVFRRAKRACGINVPGNTHLLRKSRATLFVDGQINDRTTMQFFGWNGQKTMNHYHRASTVAMKNAIDELDNIVYQHPAIESQKSLTA